jgi:hypothetical protein
MKRNISVVVGMVVLALVFGLILGGCNLGCPNNGCTVSTDKSGNTCTESGCDAYNAMMEGKGRIAACDC